MTPDQEALVGLAADVLPTGTWKQLDDSGLLGIAVPEAEGGAGLGLEEVLLILEQQGRFVAVAPLWEHLIATLGLAKANTPAGTAKLSLSLEGTLVSGTPDAVVGIDADGVFFAPVTDLGPVIETTNHTPSYEPTLGDRQRLDVDPAWLEDIARLGLCAQQLGNVDAGVREAAAYLSEREQFGRPLATFQATQQQLGDAYCDVQAMRATLWQAAFTLACKDVDVACWWATDAGERAQHIVQHLHGGIGADITYPVHHRLLWTMRINAFLGGPTRQLVRLGKQL
jgi:alkylation response protein AidB-like acyl-CoA dehydrogenase